MHTFVPRRCISGTGATVTWCLGPGLHELALPISLPDAAFVRLFYSCLCGFPYPKPSRSQQKSADTTPLRLKLSRLAKNTSRRGMQAMDEVIGTLERTTPRDDVGAPQGSAIIPTAALLANMAFDLGATRRAPSEENVELQPLQYLLRSNTLRIQFSQRSEFTSICSIGRPVSILPSCTEL